MLRGFAQTDPKVADSVFIAENALLIGDVEIGEDSSVWFGSVLRGDVNYIRIGARTNIQDMTMIHVASSGDPTILEDEITIGHRVTLHACYVESRCLIGMGAILMDGVRVGNNSIVAAGSLLTPGTIRANCTQAAAGVTLNSSHTAKNSSRQRNKGALPGSSRCTLR